MKSCPCGTTGPNNFYRNRTRPDGLSFYCKTCTAKQRREEYARKYPDGKNGGLPERFRKMAGNKLAWIHGRYAGDYAKRNPRPVIIPELTYLDRLIRTSWALQDTK